MNKKFLVLIITGFILSACQPSSRSIKMVEIPMSTQASKLSAILLSNGFETNPICDSPCFSYDRSSLKMVANIQNNDELIVHVFKDPGGKLDLLVLQNVITQAYGPDLLNWITEHLDAALTEDQTGSLGNLDIWMRIYEDKGIITISPKEE